ncbi:MAG: dihydroorotase family protein [Thermodesulfobacteriota bacterium]
MRAELAIKNCRIVDSRMTCEGVIHISGGKIIGITRSLQGAPGEVIDADGLFVLPGAIDGHVHMMDPGYTDREDFITGTGAAARGGVTTVIDHHRTEPQVYSAKELKGKRDYLSERSLVDFGLLGGLKLTNRKDLRGMWEAGALGMKGFTCEVHGAEPLSAGDLAGIFEEIKSFGGVALIHAEDDSILKHNEKKLRESGRKDYLSVSEWRSREAEAMAVKQVIDLAEATGARVGIAHVSLPELVDYIWSAKGRGALVYSETCPQYFTLTVEDLEEKGPFNKFTPPPRTREDADGIWRSLRMNKIDMVNTDHCPFPREEKEKGLDDIWEAPFGIPGIETTTRFLLDGVARGLISINQVVRLRGENSSLIYGLDDRKGFIQVGYDADLIFVDLEREAVLEDKEVVSKCKWTPYPGKKIRGDVVLTMVRGKVVMKDGEVVGSPGWGEFVTRSH